MDALPADLEIEFYEENLYGFDIFVEPNPDNWRGGFQWTVSQDNEELECGLEFSSSLAMDVARRCIEKITQGKSITVASNN
jgi:hypothetical protein